MITIDVHAHLTSSRHLDPENPVDLGFLESMSGLSIGEDFPVELLLSEMDKGGIQITVIQGHAPNSGVLNANDELAAIVREHPDRLAAFAGVNPFEGKKAVEELEHCVKELGFKGCGEFGYMDFLDERCSPIYEKCIELDVPILIHTGFTSPTRDYRRPSDAAHAPRTSLSAVASCTARSTVVARACCTRCSASATRTARATHGSHTARARQACPSTLPASTAGAAAAGATTHAPAPTAA